MQDRAERTLACGIAQYDKERKFLCEKRKLVTSGRPPNTAIELQKGGDLRRAAVRDRAGAALLVADASSAALDNDVGVRPTNPVLPGAERRRVDAGL